MSIPTPDTPAALRAWLAQHRVIGLASPPDTALRHITAINGQNQQVTITVSATLLQHLSDDLVWPHSPDAARLPSDHLFALRSHLPAAA